jgi:hypothetical protein
VKSSFLRRIALTIGGMAVVTIFFFGTLFVLDFLDPDAVRVKNAKSIMAALEKYRATKGTYPILPIRDSRTTELAGALVSGGYLDAIPADPPGAEPIHYASFDGKSFGLWMHFVKASQCKIVIGAPSAGWWGDLPVCQF